MVGRHVTAGLDDIAPTRHSRRRDRFAVVRGTMDRFCWQTARQIHALLRPVQHSERLGEPLGHGAALTRRGTAPEHVISCTGYLLHARYRPCWHIYHLAGPWVVRRWPYSFPGVDFRPDRGPMFH